MSEPTDPVALATARHRLYGLLGQLVADGLVAELRPVIQALPALRPLLDSPPEDLATEHTRWFTHELSPHAAAFFDGVLDGPTTAQVRATWHAAGFAPGRTDLEDDHLAVHLAALSFLCAAELEARQDGIDPAPVLLLQQRVLTPLQGWVPLLAHAIEGPWGCVAGLAAELIDDHAEADQGPSVPPPGDDDKVGAQELMVPAQSGWVATWTTLNRLGDESGCPMGFGSKARSLKLLLDDEGGKKALLAHLVDAGPEAWREHRERVATAL